jgi:hypothetical protein
MSSAGWTVSNIQSREARLAWETVMQHAAGKTPLKAQVKHQRGVFLDDFNLGGPAVAGNMFREKLTKTYEAVIIVWEGAGCPDIMEENWKSTQGGNGIPFESALHLVFMPAGYTYDADPLKWRWSKVVLFDRADPKKGAHISALNTMLRREIFADHYFGEDMDRHPDHPILQDDVFFASIDQTPARSFDHYARVLNPFDTNHSSVDKQEAQVEIDVLLLRQQKDEEAKRFAQVKECLGMD